MKEFWIYTGLRIALFVASLGVVAGVWMLASDEVPVVWVIVIAFAVSGVASYVLLAPQRRQVQSGRLVRPGALIGGLRVGGGTELGVDLGTEAAQHLVLGRVLPAA